MLCSVSAGAVTDSPDMSDRSGEDSFPSCCPKVLSVCVALETLGFPSIRFSVRPSSCGMQYASSLCQALGRRQLQVDQSTRTSHCAVGGSSPACCYLWAVQTANTCIIVALSKHQAGHQMQARKGLGVTCHPGMRLCRLLGASAEGINSARLQCSGRPMLPRLLRLDVCPLSVAPVPTLTSTGCEP